eukprot:GILJ01025980.1.p2 GENE.GILJ01025980.1~~GILJ01025980.1.p2  ORF type:complete len:107 (-),score=11.32 GILJ01025980.1:453-773(-)
MFEQKGVVVEYSNSIDSLDVIQEDHQTCFDMISARGSSEEERVFQEEYKTEFCPFRTWLTSIIVHRPGSPPSHIVKRCQLLITEHTRAVHHHLTTTSHHNSKIRMV